MAPVEWEAGKKTQKLNEISIRGIQDREGVWEKKPRRKKVTPVMG